ncbi:GNAT family N-acetyltransferase [uncultured Gulosibacter sp.]|uniref:GNAT family N-acetyltransferase n=1 Tax=uncultured Gulosibacter sp. TaxID=1339167 RepID=UPI00288BCD23|nr:GNAT family N-acetyltransferase [uncultured Gulosibacter sp.]
MTDSGSYTYTRDASRSRFVVHHGDQLVGFMSFVDQGDRIIIDHTVVDEAHQGGGVASQLVAHGLRELAETTTATIVPECSYVAMWLRRHPEFGYLTTRGTGASQAAEPAAEDAAERLDSAKVTPALDDDSTGVTEPTSSEQFGIDQKGQ